MPTTYKVLGQVTGTAPTTAATTVNLVGDSSYEGISFASVLINPTAADNNYQLATSTFGTLGWKLGSQDINICKWTNNTIQSVATSTGYGSNAFGFFQTQAGYSGQMCIGKRTGSSYASSTTGDVDTATAIAVSPSSTYYIGFSFYRNSGAVQTQEVRIQRWTSAGVYINGNVWSQASGDWSSSTGVDTWYRYTNNFSTESNCAYVTVEIRFVGNTNNQFCLFDGITLTSSSSYNSTFVSPVNNTAVAPFTSRFSPYYSGTPYFSTSIYTYAGTQNTLYTVPSATQTVVSTIAVANLGTTASTYRIAVKPSGQTLATKHWVAFDVPIGANSTETFTLGVTLNTGDSIVVQTDSSFVSFGAFGSEIA